MATTIEDLEKRIATDYEALETRLRVKDEVISGLDRANKALMDQLKQQWVPVQIIGSVLGVLMAAAFTYQVFRAEEIRQNAEKSETVAKELTESTRQFASGVNSQAKVLADIADSLAQSNEGYRKYTAGRYADAAVNAEAAYSELRRASYEIEGIASVAPPAPAKAADLPSVRAADLVTPLGDAVKDARFAAASLLALSYYSAKETDEAGRIADELVLLDAHRFEGYHFRALVHDRQHRPLAEIAADYELSAAHKSGPNVDLMNLSEIYFRIAKYGESIERGEQYKAADVNGPPTFRLACDVFITLSHYVLGTGNGDLAELKKRIGESPTLSFKSTVSAQYEFTFVDDYEKNGLPLVNPPERRAAIKELLEWLRDHA